MSDQTLPRYVSHKEVGALEIKEVLGFFGSGQVQLVFKDDRFAPRIVTEEVVTRYKPVPGDFYVLYNDGYVSISPRKAFVEGYTKL